MNEHVGEIMIEFKTLLLLELLHLFDLLLLLNRHVWHLIVHDLLVVGLVDVLWLLVLLMSSVVDCGFWLNVILKVFILVLLTDILIQVIIVIQVILIIFISCGRLWLLVRVSTSIIDPE